MSDHCPFCDQDTALVLTHNSDGWLMTCTECGRTWTTDMTGEITSE